MPLKNIREQCPYCGEEIDVVVEELDQPQTYIEDCSVCCRPIQWNIRPLGAGELEIGATRTDS